MATIYVGCSLTNAPGAFVKDVENFKSLLRSEGHTVMDFLGVTVGTEVEVYETDIHRCVANCDVLVGILDYPSTGLGWELGTAVEKHRKPVLAVAHRDAKISRLPIGAQCNRNRFYRFVRYRQLEDLVSILADFLKEVRDARVLADYGL